MSVHAPPPPSQHNAQPKGPQPWWWHMPTGNTCARKPTFFKQWKPVLSLGFNTVCLHCVFRESIFEWVAILINMFLIKNVCGQITWSISKNMWSLILCMSWESSTGKRRLDLMHNWLGLNKWCFFLLFIIIITMKDVTLNIFWKIIKILPYSLMLAPE